MLGSFTDCTGVVKSEWVMTFFSIFDASGIYFDVSAALVWIMGDFILPIPALPWPIIVKFNYLLRV